MSIKEAPPQHIDRRKLLLRGSQGLAALSFLYAMSQGISRLGEATRDPTNGELLAKFYPEAVEDHFSLANFKNNRTQVRLYDAAGTVDPRSFEEMYTFIASTAKTRPRFSITYLGYNFPVYLDSSSQDYYLFFFGDSDSQRPSWVRGTDSDTTRSAIRYNEVTASFVSLTSSPEENVGEELARGLFDLQFVGKVPAKDLQLLFGDITAMSFGVAVTTKRDGLSYKDYEERMGHVTYFDSAYTKTYPSVVFGESLYGSIPSITLTKS